jgi:hypothetical protein
MNVGTLRFNGMMSWGTILAVMILTGLSWGETIARLDDRPPYRLILIKADGLPPDMMGAVATGRPDLMARLPYADDLKDAMAEYRRSTGRVDILPNIRKYFYEDGVVFDNVYSHTVTLSAVAWGVIDSGQPSVTKGHGTFSRDTCYLRSHLDGLRDTLDALWRRPGFGEFKTSATWVLDQAGVGIMLDAYDPLRAWTGPQIYRRIAGRALLAEGGLQWLKAEGNSVGEIVRGHLSRQVTGMDYTEFNQEMNSTITARRILDHDYSGQERYDYLSPFFTLMDHQQHVDPHPINLVYYLTRLDWAIGNIFKAVGQSKKRDHTIVVLTSDHGSEIKPGQTGFSFPISKVFRERLYGGHNVRTLLVENAWSAITTPLPGYDWPRLYESPYSPYSKKGNPETGEKGFTTAFLDPFGNGRAAVHLRNNDLNRLHLILMKLKKAPSPESFRQLKELFRGTFNETLTWLEPDLALYEDYHEGSSDLANNLLKRADRASHDTAKRLLEEFERDAVQIEALKRLSNLTFEEDQEGIFFDEVFSKDFKVSTFLPKEYLGLANSLNQLMNYTVGLDDDLNWIETVVDHQGRQHPLNYFEILKDYRAANAPINGLANPYDFTAAAVPVSSAKEALVSRGMVRQEDELKNVAWVKSTQQPTDHKGGEALLVETLDRRIKYVPIKNLSEDPNGELSFDLVTDIDPLSILRRGGLDLPSSAKSELDWLRSFHPWREWLPAVKGTEYSSGIIVILDIINNQVPEFVDAPEFQKYLINFSSSQAKERYLRGVKRKYAARAPDFLIWADELWNFNSKARTSGGNHSGLRAITTKTVFSLWGGRDTGLLRGKTVDEVCSTVDVAPTLFEAMGMLDEKNRVIKAKNASPSLLIHPLYGKAINVRSKPDKRWQVEEPE